MTEWKTLDQLKHSSNDGGGGGGAGEEERVFEEGQVNPRKFIGNDRIAYLENTYRDVHGDPMSKKEVLRYVADPDLPVPYMPTREEILEARRRLEAERQHLANLSRSVGGTREEGPPKAGGVGSRQPVVPQRPERPGSAPVHHEPSKTLPQSKVLSPQEAKEWWEKQKEKKLEKEKLKAQKPKVEKRAMPSSSNSSLAEGFERVRKLLGRDVAITSEKPKEAPKGPSLLERIREAQKNLNRRGS